ncbi:MAG: hypothetical protein NT023_16935 [Armatimonadetes bacterium]|nr:hypothetical protein [Armatimonadota bacterium]
MKYRVLLVGLWTIIALLMFQPLTLSQGRPWAWGDNALGQLGDGTTTEQHSPVQTPNLSNVYQVSVSRGGGGFGLAVKLDGTVWAWGQNKYGQLGDGTRTTRTTPINVPNLVNVVQIGAGLSHSLALKADGTVWAWGNNSDGALGTGDLVNSKKPVQVIDVSNNALTNVVQISVGRLHNVALKSDGSAWAWGNDFNGQLGDGTYTARPRAGRVTDLVDVVQVSAGFGNTFVVRLDGTVWSCGGGLAGQLGFESKNTHGEYAPVQVPGLTGVKMIATGNQHTLALKWDGTVWAFGRNVEGELGDGTKVSRYTPKQVAGLSGIVRVSAGGQHCAAVKLDGTVWAWGYNNKGQLGDGTTTTKFKPVQVQKANFVNQNNIVCDLYETFSVQSAQLQTSLSVVSVTVGYSSPFSLIANLLDERGLPAVEQPVNFFLDSTLVGSANTNAGGTATLDINPNPFNPGTYTLTAKTGIVAPYYYDSFDTGKLTITKADTSLKVNSAEGEYGDKIPLMATLTNNLDGSPIANAKVKFIIKTDPPTVVGTATTNAAGQAIRYYKLDGTIKAGIYVLAAEYAGDTSFNKSSSSSVLQINLVGTTLEIGNYSKKIGAMVPFKALLTTTKKHYRLEGKTVHFLIDGDRKGDGITGVDGYARFSYTIPLTFTKGAHTITVVFDEMDPYAKSEGKGTLIVN